MNVNELVNYKQDVSRKILSHQLIYEIFLQLECEYQRLPITVSGKSL